ncbi:MAG: FMN-binding protein [Bacteroidales bacterium]|nr:FMN-binding protein [Bacteroidales bacterium]MBR5063550.1 FMN-binding protein [Bacteroidales bacterium]
MKKILLLVAIVAVLSGTFAVSTACGSSQAKGPDTLRINTTDLGKDIIGYNGPTPVEITVVSGNIVDIKALPNMEGPRYMQAVRDGGLLKKLVGKSVKEAKDIELDAVSGATYTSNALIKNIRLGLEKAE